MNVKSECVCGEGGVICKMPLPIEERRIRCLPCSVKCTQGELLGFALHL